MSNEWILVSEDDLMLWDDSPLELVCCQRCDVIYLFGNCCDRMFMELIIVNLMCYLALMNLIRNDSRVTTVDSILFTVVGIYFQAVFLCLVLSDLVLEGEFV